MNKEFTQDQIFEIIKSFSGQNNVVVIPRIFIQILENIPAAIFLNQLIYWQDKMKGEWLFKTYSTWKEETGLSEHEIRKATLSFKEIGFLETEVKKANGSPTVHYRLNHEKFLEWFLNILSMENENFKNLYINTINKESFNKLKDKGILKKSQTFKKSIYLELWNSLKEKYSMLQQHNNPEKKVYQKAASMINHLKNGTFGDHYHIDPDFMKKNHIRFSLLEKKFSKEEIKICIERLPKLFIEGYWPPDKKWLPKDLPTLIYNSRTNTSWLLHVFTHPPRPMNQEKTDTEIENKIKYKHRGEMTEEEYKEIPAIKEVSEFLGKFG